MFLRTKYRSQNLLNLILIQREIIVNTIVLKPGPARRVDPGCSRPGTAKKKEKVMTRSKTWLQPIEFFSTKTTLF